MAGLFDYQDPESVGRMMFAAGLLNAAGPSKMPVSTGQALAQGLMGRQQGASEAAQNARRNMLMEAQAANLRSEAEARLREKKQQKYINLGGGNYLDTETGSVHQAPQAPKEENTPAALLMLKAAGIDPASPRGQQIIRDNLVRPFAPPAPANHIFMPTGPNGEIFGLNPRNPGAPVPTGLTAPPKPVSATAAAAAEEAAKGPEILSAAVNRAQQLLPVATGSGAGALRDKATDFVGMETDAAKAATELETIAAQLIRFAPRFKGQDSNRDVIIYNNAVGAVGDRTKPAPYRMQALSTAQMLINKYQEKPAAPATSGGGSSDVATLRAQAADAIARGADRAKVAERFKRQTGQDL